MALPELTKRRVEKVLTAYCSSRVPDYLKSEVRLGFRFRGNSATLYEERQAFGRKDVWVDIVIAQFRFNIMTREWTLYFADRNSRWRPYSDACPTSNFDVLLNEVDKDGRGIFWG